MTQARHAQQLTFMEITPLLYKIGRQYAKELCKRLQKLQVLKKITGFAAPGRAKNDNFAKVTAKIPSVFYSLFTIIKTPNGPCPTAGPNNKEENNV